MQRVLLAVITLFVSTVAVTNDGIYEGNKFISSLADSKSPIDAQEVAVVGHVGKVYDYRSNNGIISPLSYISVPQKGYRKFREAMRQFQNFPSVLLQRGGNSSDSGDGSSVEDNESENINTSKAVNSSDYTLLIRDISSNTAEAVGRPPSFYRDNYGTLSAVHYILAPQVGYQAYGEGGSQFQVPLAMDKSSSDTRLNNSTSLDDNDVEDTKTSETISSNDTLVNQQLPFIQYETLLNTTVENSTHTDLKQSEIFENETLKTAVLPTELSESNSSVQFDLISRKPELNDQGFTSHSSTAFNQFAPYWLMYHPSLITNDISSSYFVLNPLIYPIVPPYQRLML